MHVTVPILQRFFFLNSFLESWRQNCSYYYPVQGSHGARTHPGPKHHTRNMMQGLCSGYYQGSLRALKTQWQAPCAGLQQHLCWDVDTQPSCSVLLSSLGGKDCPCHGTPRLVAPHRQSPARALEGVCPRQCLDGVSSRPNDHREEQSIGVPVRGILNTMGPFDQQWYDRQSLWPCMRLRDTVIPSLTSHFRSIIINGRVISVSVFSRKQQTIRFCD